jgi:hypothetical protein
MANGEGGFKPNSSFVSDAKFFAQNAPAQSLPVSTPTDAATSQEPAVVDATDNLGLTPNSTVQQKAEPVAPDFNPLAPQFPIEAAPAAPKEEAPKAEEPAAPVIEEKPENLFSTDIPEIATVLEPDVSVDTDSQKLTIATTIFDEFKPTADKPSWHMEQFAGVVNDPNLNDEEKREILQQTPYSWGKDRKRVRDSRILGKFRDVNEPIDTVVSTLREQNSGRFEQLEMASVASLLGDGAKVLKFATEQPETYAKLMFALVDEAHEEVASILGRRGYVIQQAEPVSADSILDKFKASPYYATIAGTDLEDGIIEEVTRLAQSQPAAKADDPANPAPAPAANEMSPEVKAQAWDAYQTTQTQVWNRSLSEGLAAKGIVPATKAEVEANPLAMLKTVIHAIGVHGLDGVVPKSDEQIDKFVGNNADYEETVGTLENLIKSGKTDEFKALARELAPTYYRFGEARAGMPFIKGLYKQVQQLLGEAAPPVVADPATPPADDAKIPEVTGGSAPNAAMVEKLLKSPNAADRLLGMKMQRQG